MKCFSKIRYHTVYLDLVIILRLCAELKNKIIVGLQVLWRLFLSVRISIIMKPSNLLITCNIGRNVCVDCNKVICHRIPSKLQQHDTTRDYCNSSSLKKTYLFLAPSFHIQIHILNSDSMQIPFTESISFNDLGITHSNGISGRICPDN